MPVAKAGETVYVDFPVQNPTTAALTNADSLPTGVISHNGTDDVSVTVTVTNKATGRYKAEFTIPSDYEIGDEVDLFITAIVGGVTGGDVIWRSTLEGVAGGITDSVLKNYFAAMMRKTGAVLVTQFDTMVPRANNWAYNRVVTILAGRGFTKAQVDAWDEIEEYNLYLGVYWLLTHGAVIEATNMSREFINSFDMEYDLHVTNLTASGAYVDPSGYARGGR